MKVAFSFFLSIYTWYDAPAFLAATVCFIKFYCINLHRINTTSNDTVFGCIGIIVVSIVSCDTKWSIIQYCIVGVCR